MFLQGRSIQQRDAFLTVFTTAHKAVKILTPITLIGIKKFFLLHLLNNKEYRTLQV